MKKIIVMGFALLSLMACDDLADLNIDKKNPQIVPAGSLFANATTELFKFTSSSNVNVNNFRLWAQQWAQTTYADESNYEVNERNVTAQAWNRMYATVIRDIRDSKKFIEADDVILPAKKASQLAILEVVELFAWHLMVDMFGNIPYTEALTDDVTPAYDKDADIYNSLATRLDAAIANLSGDSGLGNTDVVYGGDADKWKKVANSLKLRMAIRIADVNPGKAKTMAEQAIPGVMTSRADDFQLVFQTAPPHTNPLWLDLIQSGRSDFIAASSIVEPMTALSDPRLDKFFKDPVDDGTGTVRILGGTYGDNNNYNAFSHPGTRQLDPTFPGKILSYTEVQFLLADAAERGFSGAGSAADRYAMGVTSSILEWGGTQADADAYLAQEAVAYATAPGTWKQKIALQKWIALYDQGFEAWTTYRLYDWPALPMAVQAQMFPPTRYTYPVTEYTLNETSVAAASAAIGGDALHSKIFWDVN